MFIQYFILCTNSVRYSFGQKQLRKPSEISHNATQTVNCILCYCWFELMKNTIPEIFSQPKKKILVPFTDSKIIPFDEVSNPKNSLNRH